MINVLIHGANGRMGQEVAKVIEQQENLKIVAGFDQVKSESSPFPIFTKIGDLLNFDTKIDVIIDFSVPEATLTILDFAKEKHIPIVIATTGFTKEQLEQIKDTSKSLPIFQSANMSFDINLMGKLVAEVAKKLYDTDIEIIESHHNRKIDAPSGTAILLADKIKNANGIDYEYVFDRHSKHEKRGKKEIGFSSIRGGNIVGEHTVEFIGPNETFQITHTSYSRTVFAEGAVKAAIFLTTQENGFYNMDNLVK